MRKIFLLYITTFIPILTFSNELDSLKVVYQNTNDDTTRIYALVKIASLEKEQDYEIFKERSEDALAQSLEINYEYGLMMSYSNLGIYNYFISKYYEAIKYYDIAIEYAIKTNSKKQLSFLYNYKGVALERMGEFKEAIEEYHRSIKIKEETNNKLGIAYTSSNIGSLYIEIYRLRKDKEHLTKAKEYIEKSLLVFLELEDERGIAIAYSNLGLLYDNKREFEQAIDYYLKTIEIDEKNNASISDLVIDYNNVGSCYEEKKDYELAIYYYGKALTLCKKSNYPHGLVLVLSNLASCHYSMDQLDKALSYIQEAERKLDKEKFSEIRLQIDLIFYLVYKKRKEFNKSLYHYEQYMQKKDSISSTEKVIEIARIEAKHKYEKEKKTNSLKQLQTEKANTISDLLILLCFALVLLIILSGLNYFNIIKLSPMAASILFGLSSTILTFFLLIVVFPSSEKKVYLSFDDTAKKLALLLFFKLIWYSASSYLNKIKSIKS